MANQGRVARVRVVLDGRSIVRLVLFPDRNGRPGDTRLWFHVGHIAASARLGSAAETLTVTSSTCWSRSTSKVHPCNGHGLQHLMPTKRPAVSRICSPVLGRGAVDSGMSPSLGTINVARAE